MSGASSITLLGTENVSGAHNTADMKRRAWLILCKLRFVRVQCPQPGNTPAISQGQCTPMPLPSLGTHSILRGNGTNVGTVISLKCPDHHTLMGDKVVCVKGTNSSQWVGEPYCRPLSAVGEFGLRVAVLASVVSSAVILLLTISFITCCLHERFKKKKKKRQKLIRETEEELREQHAGGRAGNPPPPHHPHPHHCSWNNNNNNNNSNHQKAAAPRQGGHDGVFVDNEAPCGSRLHLYHPHPVPSSVPLLPGTGYTRSPAAAAAAAATRDAPGPEQDAAGPPHGSSLYLQRHTWPAPHRPLLAQHTSQESRRSSEECSIRIVSV